MFLLKRGNKWYVEFFDEREKRKKRISTGTSKKSDALVFVSEYQRKLSTQPVLEEKLTLQGFSDKYFTYLNATHSEKYARDAKAAFNKLISFTGNMPLEDLSRKTLEDFFVSSFKRAKYETARNYRTIKAAIKRAIDWSDMSHNPIEKIKLPKLPQNFPVYTTEDKLELIKAKIANPTVSAIIEFAFLTGCRQGEILNLKWRNVDLAEGLMKIGNSAEFLTKTKKERFVPLTKRLSALIVQRMPADVSPEDFVFGKSRKVAYSGNYISRRFKKAVIDAGLDNRLHFHSLRHSTATELIRRNTPVTVVQKLLGHSNIATTMIYTHVANDDVKEALKKFDKQGE